MRRELPSHVLSRHARATTRMSCCEILPCAAVFGALCAGPLPALAALHHGTRDYRQSSRPTAAGE